MTPTPPALFLATPLDDLLDSLPGASASETIAVLFDLELMGLVRQMPGKSYVLVW